MKCSVLCLMLLAATSVSGGRQEERFLRELEELWERAEEGGAEEGDVGDAVENKVLNRVEEQEKRATAKGPAVQLEMLKREPLMKYRRQANSCTEKYRKLPASTMCDYQDAAGISNMGVDKKTQTEILKVHNDHRAKVSPQASNMQKMYWNEDLAVIAQKWANSCVMGHDTNEQRKVPEWGINVGQNWAGGQKSWKDAIDAWHGEVKDFSYGAYNNLGVVGHYTQVVNSNAGAVGCGYAECGNRAIKENYVCNYAYGQADINKPYASGSQCGECSGQCANGLCDCKGLVCKNGGTLDVSSCTCQCPGHAEGKECESYKCPGADKEFCGPAQPYGFPESTCKLWSNVPEECPVMCGLC